MSNSTDYIQCRKRLNLEKQQNPHLLLSPLETFHNSFRWILTIPGPPTSPYKLQIHQLEITYEPDYPLKAPTFQFLTPIFHPNIQPNGLMSNLMLECWSIYKTIANIYADVQELLKSPLKEYPYNDEAMLLWETDPAAFQKRVQNYTTELPYTRP